MGVEQLGLTSSDKKVAMCKSKFGFDEVINYKEENDLSNNWKKIGTVKLRLTFAKMIMLVKHNLMQ